jgi:hypothetical protein
MKRFLAVRSVLLFAVLLTSVSYAEAKTAVTREYAKSAFSMINILDSALPELGYKVTALDRNKGTVSFRTNNEREIAIQVTSKGKDSCSVEVTGSSWFSSEPEEAAGKVHAKINDVLIKREAQKIASAQKPQPTPRAEPGKAHPSQSKKSEVEMTDADYLEIVSKTASLMKKGANNAVLLCSRYEKLIQEYETEYDKVMGNIEEMSRHFSGVATDPAYREFRAKLLEMKRQRGTSINSICSGTLDEWRDKFQQANDTITITMKQLTKPPAKYVSLHGKVVDLYGAYSQMIKLAFNPPDGHGMPESYGRWVREVNAATKEFEKADSTVQVLTPTMAK